MKVLLVEDDIHSVRMTTFLLTEAGYHVIAACTDEAIARALAVYHPDLVLLDVSLPGINGFDLCQHIRQTSDISIIFVTGHADLESRVTGLRCGGDDYLVKPFEPIELVARVKAVLRRRTRVLFASAELLKQGEFSLDPTTHTLSWTDGRVVRLTPMECSLLTCLMKHSGHVVQTEQLLAMLWQHRRVGISHTLTVYIRRLRTKIEHTPAHPRHVITIRKSGYMFQV